ncbi:MAG: hypothetical protein HQK54_07385 [Oligoflexales bacterium]|nr:hypothetical protein [Oligoflexales bacterium]
MIRKLLVISIFGYCAAGCNNDSPQKQNTGNTQPSTNKSNKYKDTNADGNQDDSNYDEPGARSKSGNPTNTGQSSIFQGNKKGSQGETMQSGNYGDMGNSYGNDPNSSNTSQDAGALLNGRWQLNRITCSRGTPSSSANRFNDALGKREATFVADMIDGGNSSITININAQQLGITINCVITQSIRMNVKDTNSAEITSIGGGSNTCPPLVQSMLPQIRAGMSSTVQISRNGNSGSITGNLPMTMSQPLCSSGEPTYQFNTQ